MVALGSIIQDPCRSKSLVLTRSGDTIHITHAKTWRLKPRLSANLGFAGDNRQTRSLWQPRVPLAIEDGIDPGPTAAAQELRSRDPPGRPIDAWATSSPSSLLFLLLGAQSLANRGTLLGLSSSLSLLSFCTRQCIDVGWSINDFLHRVLMAGFLRFPSSSSS